MSSISGTTTIRPGAAAAASVPPTAPPAASPPAPATEAPPVSGLRAAIRRVSGLPAGFDADKVPTSGWSNMAAEGLTGNYVVRPSASYFVGYGDITRIDPTVDGFEIDVQCYGSDKNDKIALFLQLPIYEKKSGQLTFFNLDLLTYDPDSKATIDAITTTAMNDPVSGKPCFGGRRTYRFSLAQINDFIKSQGLDLEVKPGTRLSISGLVNPSGHRVMNAASNGFSVPRPIGSGATSPVTAQVNAMTGRQTVKAQDLPLDLCVKLSQDILDTYIYDYATSYQRVRVGDIIEGDITTRLESEYKGAVAAQQMDAMTAAAYAITGLAEKAAAGDGAARQALEQRLGSGLSLAPVKRHWLASDGQPVGQRDPTGLTIPRDDKGRPSLDPMKDTYSDDRQLTFAKKSGGVRVRGNAQKQGHAEFKLSGGVRDPKSGIVQRVEIGLTLKPQATPEMLRVLFKHIRDNPSSKVSTSPLGHVVREAQKEGVTGALIENRTPWADVTQNRHKFEAKKTATGTSVEVSLDTVDGTTLRREHEKDGKPQTARYHVIELELDHLQINSANVTEMPNTKQKQALLTPAAQEKFVKDMQAAVKSGKAELEILAEPQLHSIDHVLDGSFRQTASYKEFEQMVQALLEALCGAAKPGPAWQKAAHFAEVLGLVTPEPLRNPS